MNAIHAMHGQAPHRRTLTVRVVEDRSRVRVEVEDVGPGIPEEDRPRLFNAFFTTKTDGLGLGLPICRSIIDQHGGEINCEHLGTGTRFEFSVPIIMQQATSAPHPPGPPTIQLGQLNRRAARPRSGARSATGR
jgi:signal transduction histidine kinase